MSSSRAGVPLFLLASSLFWGSSAFQSVGQHKPIRHNRRALACSSAPYSSACLARAVPNNHVLFSRTKHQPQTNESSSCRARHILSVGHSGDLSAGKSGDEKSFVRINDNKIVHDHITVTDKLVIGLTIMATVFACVGLYHVSGPGGWRYYVAGGICAATSHAIGTPIDVVKTRQQVDPSLKDMGLIELTAKIVKEEGIQALLAGLGPTALGYLIEGAIKFGIYEVMKPAARRFLVWLASVSSISSLNSRVLGFIICGGVSGVAASAMLCPMEALRIRLVAEPDFAPDGWIAGGFRMLKNEGVGGLWKGIMPMMCKQVPYTITKNVSFDYFATMAYATARSWGYAITAKTRLVIPLVSAMVASVLSCISSQPGDLLLSVTNAHEGTRRTRDFAKDILQGDDGVRGFFVGIKARFLHVGFMVTLQLLIYDLVKRLVGIGATGST